MNSPKVLTKRTLVRKINEEKALVATQGESAATKLTKRDLSKGWKRTEEEKLNIIKVIAEGLTRSQIISEVHKRYGLTVTHMDIFDFQRAKKWQPILKELQEKHAQFADTLDASKKHVRVKRMEVVFDDAIAKGKTRDALQAHSLIQKEYEKDGDTINVLMQNNSLYQQLNILSPDELLKRHREATLKLKEKQNGSSGETVEDSK